MMSGTRPLRRWAGVGATVVFLTPLGACSVLGLGGVSTSHQELEGEWSDADVPGSVSEVAWEWVAEGHWGNVELTALPGGVLASTLRGVVALDGVTGEERWSFTVEDEVVRVWTDVSSSGERVHVLFPKDDPEEEAEDTEEDTSEGIPGRRVVLDGVTGEIVGDLEETITGDIEELSVFDVESATDAGLFGLGSEPLLSARMRSDEDRSELWRTEDLFTCDDESVARAERPVVFPDAVVVRAECDSGGAEAISLDPVDGEVLWHLEGDSTDFLTSLNSVRRVGGLLAVDQGSAAEYWDEEFVESVVLDPVTGEAVGAEIEEGRYPARTFGDGFLTSHRSLHEDSVGYELRRFNDETLATADQAVATSAPGSYVLALEEAVVKLGLEASETPIDIAPWGGGESHRIDLPEPVEAAGSFQPRQPEGRFEAVPGAVVLVDLSGSQDEGIKVIGLR